MTNLQVLQGKGMFNQDTLFNLFFILSSSFNLIFYMLWAEKYE